MDGYDDEVPPAEAARERRRDRDAEAGARAGMRTGLAKQFKQVLDSAGQARPARTNGPHADRDAAHGGTENEPRRRRR